MWYEFDCIFKSCGVHQTNWGSEKHVTDNCMNFEILNHKIMENGYAHLKFNKNIFEIRYYINYLRSQM